MEQVLSADSVKSFFSDFLEQYKLEVEKNYSNHRDKLILFNSFPIKVEMLFDREMRYGIVLLSKNQGFTQFSIDNSFQDPMIVVAVANTKRYQYCEQSNFLYLFQLNAKRFSQWQVSNFVKDFINYELFKNSFR
ncbi:MAG: hypothetical protein N3G19_03310 [Candidatus Pacearchaeota archaeon]|nr:hypothetical protein [Candidatus Pacearchaeota archaeon]